jgi:hypothetical protein
MAKIDDVNLPKGVVFTSTWGAFIVTFRRIYNALTQFLSASKADIKDLEARVEALETTVQDHETRITNLEP